MNLLRLFTGAMQKQLHHHEFPYVNFQALYHSLTGSYTPPLQEAIPFTHRKLYPSLTGSHTTHRKEAVPLIGSYTPHRHCTTPLQESIPLKSLPQKLFTGGNSTHKRKACVCCFWKAFQAVEWVTDCLEWRRGLLNCQSTSYRWEAWPF